MRTWSPWHSDCYTRLHNTTECYQFYTMLHNTRSILHNTRSCIVLHTQYYSILHCSILLNTTQYYIRTVFNTTKYWFNTTQYSSSILLNAAQYCCRTDFNTTEYLPILHNTTDTSRSILLDTVTAQYYRKIRFNTTLSV